MSGPEIENDPQFIIKERLSKSCDETEVSYDYKSPRSHFSLGGVLPTEKRMQALKDFDKEVMIPNASIDGKIQNAERLVEKGNDSEAIKIYESLLSTEHPTDLVQFEILKNLGNCYLRLGQIDRAEDSYSKCYTICPDSDVLLVNLGTLSIQKNNLAQAIEFFRKAVEINDLNSKAWLGLGLVHREFGDIELAWANLEKSLDCNPGDSTAIALVIDWAVKDGRYPLAEILIDRYLLIHPNEVEIHRSRAKLYFLWGKYLSSLAVVEHVLKIQDDPELLEIKDLIEKLLSQSAEANR